MVQAHAQCAARSRQAAELSRRHRYGAQHAAADLGARRRALKGGIVPEIAELDLPHLAMEQDWFAADPAPQFAAARAQHPWLATSIYGYVVTSFPAMRQLVAMEAKVLRTAYDEMVESMGALDTPWGRFQQKHILAANGLDHERLRRVLAPAFTPRQAKRHRPLMRAVISQLLDEWAPRGAFDFEEFASWFPITVMCRMIGASPEIIPSMRSSLEAL